MFLIAEFLLCAKSIHCSEGREIPWQGLLSQGGLKAKCLMCVADLRFFASDMVLARPQFPE